MYPLRGTEVNRKWVAGGVVALVVLTLFCCAGGADTPEPIPFRDLSTPSPTQSTNATQVPPSPAERDGSATQSAQVSPHTPAEFVAWRETFLDQMAENQHYCGGWAEVSCDDAACVVRIDPGPLAFAKQLARRPRIILERFATDALGMPREIDSCQYALNQLNTYSTQTHGVSGKYMCWGYSPRVDMAAPAAGAQMRDGKCINCPQIVDPGPPRASHLCEQLSGQTLHQP